MDARSVALIGPCPFEGHPETIGGATRLFELLLDDARDQGWPHTRVVTNRPGGKSSSAQLRGVLAALAGPAGRPPVWMVNGSKGTVQHLFPLLWTLGRGLGKRVVLRAFGAHLLDTIAATPHRRLLQRVLRRTDRVYVETQGLVQRLQDPAGDYRLTQVGWLPNVRRLPEFSVDLHRPYRRRFLFVGQLMATKGVPALLRVFDRLGPDFQLRVYGPLAEPALAPVLGDPRYGGVLDRAGVDAALREADVLVLPTTFPGEGYPGVILEAMAHGVPCLSTRWRFLPELVEDGLVGRLLPPGDEAALERAIRDLDEPTWRSWRLPARERAQAFSSSVVHARLFQELQALASPQP